jgi:hypothetical protein
MLKRMTLLAGLALCLALPVFAGGQNANNPTIEACLPPPIAKDYLKQTTRVEIKGKLQRVRIPNLLERALQDAPPRLPIEPPDDTIWPRPRWYFVWQITAGDKTYQVDFGEALADLVTKMNGQTVVVTGTLEGGTVHMTSLKEVEGDYVKRTEEVEVGGRLQGIHFEDPIPGTGGGRGPVVAWTVAVDGKTYSLALSGNELLQLADMYDGQSVVITGTLDKNTITVKTLKLAQ